MHEPEPEPEVEATVAVGETEEQRQIWVREFSVELHDWRRAHERGERLLQRFATAAAAVLESAGPRFVFAPFLAAFSQGVLMKWPCARRAQAAGGHWQGEPDFRTGPSHGRCIEQGGPRGGQLAKRRRVLTGVSRRGQILCVSRILALVRSLLVATDVLRFLSYRLWLVAVEDSAAGMATAIQEIRTLTAGGTDSKHPRQLAELETKYHMREAETQLKLAIVESLEGLLHSQLSGQPPAAAEGSGMRLQVLMTKYRAAWSTLPYCDDRIDEAASANEQHRPQAELAAEDNSDSDMHY